MFISRFQRLFPFSWPFVSHESWVPKEITKTKFEKCKSEASPKQVKSSCSKQLSEQRKICPKSRKHYRYTINRECGGAFLSKLVLSIIHHGVIKPTPHMFDSTNMRLPQQRADYYWSLGGIGIVGDRRDKRVRETFIKPI